MEARISLGARTFSCSAFCLGSTKKSAALTVRSPDGAAMRNVALSATSAGAVSEGCTMKLGPPPKMAWNSFSPLIEKHVLPPALKHGKPFRKYQHQGRWHTFPASVPALRICGVATLPAASESTAYLLRIRG